MKIPQYTDAPGQGSPAACAASPGDIPTVAKMAEACKRCGLCRKDCSFLKKYGHPGEIAADYQTDPAAGREIAFSCSLCGLCTAVCPLGLDPARMFLELRRDADGTWEPARYRRLLGFEKRGTSRRYTWHALPEGCTTVFFPGCALPGSRPKRTLQIYDYLQARDPAMGIVLDCCSKPSHDLGRQHHFEAAFSRLHDSLLSAGVHDVIVACPNCHKVFSRYGRGLNVTTVYERMAADGFEAAGRFNLEVTVHDPCAGRDISALHDAARTLIRSHGLKVYEMRHAKENTICCGEGGAVGCVSRDLSGQWGRRRKEEAGGRPILTYCAGCQAMLGRSTPTHHLIDLLFEPERTISGRIRVPRAPFIYLNRLRLKKALQRRCGAGARTGIRSFFAVIP